MKKYIFIFILIIGAFACSEDFLERYPTNSTVIENFYNSPEDAGQAVTAIYNMLLRDDWWSMYIFSEIRSDNCAGGAGSGDGGGFQRVDRCLQWPESNAHAEAWTGYYGGIFRANIYLEAEGQIDWTGKEDLQLQYQAEARFLRAYFHFYLTQAFGEIPALTGTIIPDEIPPRTPAEDLYDIILQDLAFAAENAMDVPYMSLPQEDIGRVTTWAAKAMMVRVYLYYSGYYGDETLKDFTAADARALADDIIQNSGHGLVPEFASLWRVPTYSELGGDTSITAYAGEVHEETLWSIRYNTNGNSILYGGARWQRMIGPRNTNIDPYGNGWGGMTVMPALWDLFDNADKRKTASILSWDDEGIEYDHVSQGQAQYTGYNVKKYLIASVNRTPEAAPDWQWNAFEDFMVIRFADVLLMGAELHLLPGGNPSVATNYVNAVRERAFGDNSMNYSAVTLEDVMLERRLELAFENVRYWDVLRSTKGDFSTLVPVLTYVDDTDGGDFSQSSDVYSLDVDGNNFVATKGLFQIPQNELDLMRGIVEQNPGYISD